ncbi:MAG: GNAT family N-acetyltransferase [Pseudomonadota bacterium]
MTLPSAERIFHATSVTWPAAEKVAYGAVTVRIGAGGGKRVSAATVDAEHAPGDISDAEKAMDDAGQPRLFMVRAGHIQIDDMLARRGYRLIDPVNQYTAEIDLLAEQELPRMATFEIWPPLAIMERIWAEGDIGPGRLAVMDRVGVAKTAIFGRAKDMPAGTAFAACDGTVAMVHALHVAPDMRRNGTARHIMIAAAGWAKANGATHLAVLCTEANQPANTMYLNLGFEPASGYHYRISD